MIRPWPLVILVLILTACAGTAVQSTAQRQGFNYSYPFRAISSEEFVPQIDLAQDRSAPDTIVPGPNADLIVAPSNHEVLAHEEGPVSLVQDMASSSPAAAQDNSSSEERPDRKNTDDPLGKLVDDLAQQNTPVAQYLADDLFIKATDASLQGSTELAIKLYRYLCRLRPQEMELQRKLAMELVRGGEVTEALQIVQGLHEQAPFADESITLALAGLYTVSGKNEEAFKLYRQAMEHFPQSESSCGMAIEAYEQAQKLDEAAQVAAVCQKRMPTAVFAYYRGRIALAQEKTALGIKFLEQALKIDPQYRPATLVLGLLAEQEGNLARAKKIYLAFLQHDENNLVIIGRLVQIYFNEQDYKSALPWTERMANLDAEDLSLKLKLAILYLDLQRVDDARSILREILTAVPDSDKAWYYLGAAEILAGEQDAAFASWAKIGEESSLFAQSRLQQAQILWAKLKKHATPENEAAFLEFLAHNENHPKVEVDFKLMRAAYAQEKGDINAALTILRQLEREQKLDMDGQYYLMVLLQESKALPEALEIGRKLLAKHPDHAHALNFMGYALLEDRQKFEEAYSYLTRAINIAPDDYYIRDSLAWYYYQTNNYTQAAQEIKLALAAAPDDAAINHHAALIALSLNKRELACTYFAKAWAAGQDNLRSEIAGQAEICPDLSFTGGSENGGAEKISVTELSAKEAPVVEQVLARPEKKQFSDSSGQESGDAPATADVSLPPAAQTLPSSSENKGVTAQPEGPTKRPMANELLLDDDPILLDPQDH